MQRVLRVGSEEYEITTREHPDGAGDPVDLAGTLATESLLHALAREPASLEALRALLAHEDPLALAVAPPADAVLATVAQRVATGSLQVYRRAPTTVVADWLHALEAREAAAALASLPALTPAGEGAVAAATETPPARLRVVEVLEVYREGGVEKTRPPATRRQYVNLDASAGDGHPEHGRTVRLKARVAWSSGTGSLAGRTVHWRARPAAHNRADLTATQRHGFDTPGGGEQLQVATDEAGWTPAVRFVTSLHGGDRFELVATEDPGGEGGASAGAYEVWRKLWYETDTLRDPGGSLASLPDAQLASVYDPCFLTLERDGRDNLPAHRKNMTAAERHALANRLFGAGRSPFMLHLLGCDHVAWRKDQTFLLEMTDEVFIDGEPKVYYDYDEPDGWKKSARFSTGRGWRKLDLERVTLTGSNRVFKHLKVNLRGLGLDPSAARPVRVELRCLVAETVSGVVENAPHAAVALGFLRDAYGASADTRAVAVLAHEIGHLLGMVPRRSPTRVDTGSGSHCRDANCLMFRENSLTRTRFCEVCRDALRALDLAPLKGLYKHPRGPDADD